MLGDEIGLGVKDAYCWVFPIIAIGIAIISLLLMGCRLQQLRRQIKPEGIYLQVVTDYSWETIWIGKICVPSEQLFLSGKREPLIKAVVITKDCCRSEIWITWGRQLKAISTLYSREPRIITLPGNVSILNKLARELELTPNVLRLVRLVRQTGGLTSVIPLGEPSLSRDGWTLIGEEPRIDENPRHGKSSRIKTEASCQGATKINKRASTHHDRQDIEQMIIIQGDPV